MGRQYAQVSLGLWLLLLLPWMLLSRQQVTESSASTVAAVVRPTYEGITLADYFDNGRLHYTLSAASLQQQSDNNLAFTRVDVVVMADSDTDSFWRITSNRAELAGDNLLFKGRVHVREQVACPVELDSSQFLYHVGAGTFSVEDGLEYRRARDKVVAKRATGVFSSGRIKVFQGVSSYNPDGQDCT